MDRRSALKFGAGLSAAYLLARGALFSSPALSATAGGEILAAAYPKEWLPFSEDALLGKARDLSLAPYSPPAESVPAAYKDIDYDQYRSIRFKKSEAIWAADKLDFTAELFHAGYIYKAPVQLFLVEGGKMGELQYDRRLFTFGDDVPKLPEDAKGGFSGFRIHTSVNRNSQLDEFVVFQGASYFRAKTAGQDYGLSARGLAIDTGQPPADEFPIFRSFWLVKPSAGASSVTVYALLDSVSVAGLYKFVISNSQNTIMEVDCTLFPRKSIADPGIAPLTSMFYFAPSNPLRADDVRPRVHDSDGLSILNGKGERIWRPLTNGKRIQFSEFFDKGVRGFGLLQRERRADRYQDFDAHYETRPSLWVEPREDWGEGSVDLVELPTANEYFDNIVAFWRPKEPLQAGRSYSYRYRLIWCYEPPLRRDIATVAETLVGQSTQHPGMRLFYVDFAGTEGFNFCDDDDELCSGKGRNLELTASSGTIANVAFRQNKISGGHRVGFEYRPADGAVEADIRCALISDGKPASEVWIYRWSA